MVLSGTIGPFSVPDVMQFLSHTRSTGKLVLDGEDDQAWAYFHQGELIYARRRGPSERLGERLLRLGYISESQLIGANLRAGLATEKKRIGQIFLEAGSVDQETLTKVITDQIRAVVAKMVAWPRGRFRFYLGRLPEDEDILLDVSLDLLLLEGLQKVDELARPEGQDRDRDSG